jgi:hypothetical protein
VRNSFLNWVKDNRSGPSTLSTYDALSPEAMLLDRILVDYGLAVHERVQAR